MSETMSVILSLFAGWRWSVYLVISIVLRDEHGSVTSRPFRKLWQTDQPTNRRTLLSIGKLFFSMTYHILHSLSILYSIFCLFLIISSDIKCCRERFRDFVIPTFGVFSAGLRTQSVLRPPGGQGQGGGGQVWTKSDQVGTCTQGVPKSLPN